MSEKEEELTSFEALVKKYLDKQTETDTALKSLYVPSKIKDCFRFITEQARKQAVNNCVMIEDSQVYKWARDYYLEELPKNADKQVVDIVQKAGEKIDNAIKNADGSSTATKEILQNADKALDDTRQLSFEF